MGTFVRLATTTGIATRKKKTIPATKSLTSVSSIRNFCGVTRRGERAELLVNLCVTLARIYFVTNHTGVGSTWRDCHHARRYGGERLWSTDGGGDGVAGRTRRAELRREFAAGGTPTKLGTAGAKVARLDIDQSAVNLSPPLPAHAKNAHTFQRLILELPCSGRHAARARWVVGGPPRSPKARDRGHPHSDLE